jgi:hypothetical protein
VCCHKDTITNACGDTQEIVSDKKNLSPRHSPGSPEALFDEFMPWSLLKSRCCQNLALVKLLLQRSQIEQFNNYSCSDKFAMSRAIFYCKQPDTDFRPFQLWKNQFVYNQFTFAAAFTSRYEFSLCLQVFFSCTCMRVFYCRNYSRRFFQNLILGWTVSLFVKLT